ncbi:unnamed protein product [Prunus armeniaca]
MTSIKVRVSPFKALAREVSNGRCDCRTEGVTSSKVGVSPFEASERGVPKERYDVNKGSHELLRSFGTGCDVNEGSRESLQSFSMGYAQKKGAPNGRCESAKVRLSPFEASAQGVPNGRYDVSEGSRESIRSFDTGCAKLKTSTRVATCRMNRGRFPAAVQFPAVFGAAERFSARFSSFHNTIFDNSERESQSPQSTNAFSGEDLESDFHDEALGSDGEGTKSNGIVDG